MQESICIQTLISHVSQDCSIYMSVLKINYHVYIIIKKKIDINDNNNNKLYNYDKYI